MILDRRAAYLDYKPIKFMIMNEIYKDNDVLCYLHMMWNNDYKKIINAVWPDDKNLAQHFIDKYEEHLYLYKALAAPSSFYAALAPKYERDLVAYARRHYGV